MAITKEIPMNLLILMIGQWTTLMEDNTMSTSIKSKFYIEYFNAPTDDSNNPIASTFTLPIKNLVYFLRRLAAAGHRIVYVQELGGNGRILLNKRNVQHINAG